MTSTEYGAWSHWLWNARIRNRLSKAYAMIKGIKWSEFVAQKIANFGTLFTNFKLLKEYFNNLIKHNQSCTVIIRFYVLITHLATYKCDFPQKTRFVYRNSWLCYRWRARGIGGAAITLWRANLEGDMPSGPPDWRTQEFGGPRLFPKLLDV